MGNEFTMRLVTLKNLLKLLLLGLVKSTCHLVKIDAIHLPYSTIPEMVKNRTTSTWICMVVYLKMILLHVQILSVQETSQRSQEGYHNINFCTNYFPPTFGPKVKGLQTNLKLFFCWYRKIWSTPPVIIFPLLNLHKICKAKVWYWHLKKYHNKYSSDLSENKYIYHRFLWINMIYL